MERVRYADAEPLAVDRTWLLASVVRPLLDVDLTATGVYDELARHGIRVTDGEERIHAVTATPAQRQRLALPRGAALLAIERVGCVDGEPIEWRESVVRGDRFSVLARWAPHTAYDMSIADGSPLPAR